MRHNNARAEPHQVPADVSAGRRIWRGRAAGDQTGRRAVLEEDDEILCRVKRKVLDPSTEIVHYRLCLARTAAWQS